jgi:tRNA nucleotidyltransferase (CCA-adding enzyme)
LNVVSPQIIQHSALSPQSWPFDLQWLPPQSYLVGGCVRDVLCGQASDYLDLDFVLPDQPVAVAQAVAHHHRAGFVLLDAERQIARVVFETATADFALQVGPTLTSDLQRRDFTVNAIAYDPHQKRILDPLQGVEDLQQRRLRMVSPHNLAEDPLRLLRAYRQAAQLNFHLEPETQSFIHQLAPLLAKVAPERVRVELSYLLSTPAGTPHLTTAWRHGLLQFWLPAATQRGLMQIAAIDQAVAQLTTLWPALRSDLQRSTSERAQGGEATRRTLLTTAKLIGLLPPEPQKAVAHLTRLKYSRSEINLVTKLQLGLAQVTAPGALPGMSRRDQYFLFQALGEAFPVLAVLAVAWGVSPEAIAPLIERYLNPDDPVAHPQPLVSGRDLIHKLHLRPGPQIGQLLKALEEAQAHGQITTQEQGLALAAVLKESLASGPPVKFSGSRNR